MSEFFAILRDLLHGQVALQDLPSFLGWLLIHGSSISRKEETNEICWALPHQQSRTEKGQA